MISVERVSLELTRRCSKGCRFCYNASDATGSTDWSASECIAFATDLASHGVKALSLGGGEPLEFEGLFDILSTLRGVLFRSMTTNGLRLDEQMSSLVEAAPEKVQLSIHFPSNQAEVSRVIRQVTELHGAGIRSGVNLLVRQSDLEASTAAARLIREHGVTQERITYLPMRGEDTPTARELALVAGGPFQSMSCLLQCGKSARFCSVGADKSVAWCSYTKTRRRMVEPTWASLSTALDGLGLQYCGGDSILGADLRALKRLRQSREV